MPDAAAIFRATSHTNMLLLRRVYAMPLTRHIESHSVITPARTITPLLLLPLFVMRSRVMPCLFFTIYAESFMSLRAARRD